ncbi:hypothetical protein HRG_002086 [Hirsutella rhossiliensis]|uniref:DUF1295-domain-containing protein n=1 Tax=Hirsutella rhossiliensis TaxID=111463 RepID=A0A9P8N4A0_9HYPO|nr:uncharacterized protein HRG_02086 [Hirsutella rhossiliensis]KAH0966677.1 hypothetical protein HRG_02086 [Hirsutella rhossiliensis]
MLLPALKSLRDCSDYALTVEPFLPQLYALPARLAAVRSLDGLMQLYVDTNPLMSAIAASIFLGGVFLVVSEANRNYSQVDRMWSFLPNLYIAHLAVWARLAGLPHSRIDLVAACTTLWSCRLTFNYWRKGGYQKGSEDYRWEIVKSKVPGFIFFLLNVTFISFIQSVLLFGISCLPAYVILLSTRFEPNITAADVAYGSIELLLVLSEWFSDGQQWTYQTAKHQYQKDAKLPRGWNQADLDRGFVTSGLWAYSRHPNFFAEQAIWFVLYHWSCYASNSLYNWTFIGSGSLILLFQGSTCLTELITAGKYPEYKDYQKQVGMFMPTSFGGYKTTPRKQKVIKASDLAKQKQK